jgi:hypothetical protein
VDSITTRPVPVAAAYPAPRKSPTRDAWTERWLNHLDWWREHRIAHNRHCEAAIQSISECWAAIHEADRVLAQWDALRNGRLQRPTGIADRSAGEIIRCE